MNLKKIFLPVFLALTILLCGCSGESSSSADKPSAAGATTPAEPTIVADDTSIADETKTNTIYKDGEYTASATGYSGGLKVKVVIEDDKIKSVEIISHNEVGKQYYEEAIEKIPQAIVLAQSTEVDAITGATKTSKGIIKAVNKVLEEAKLK